MKYLARREYGHQELRSKLVLKGYPAGVVDRVLTGLVSEGLLSDARFAEAYSRCRAEKGYGALRIRQELSRRGVDMELAPTPAEFDWVALVERTYVKKYGTTLPGSAAERASRERFLLYRGFEYDQIRTLFRKLRQSQQN